MQISIIHRSDFTDINNQNIIGQGAFGNVYKVIEKATGKEFAVKVLNGNDDNNLRKQFFNEIEIISQLDYPTVLTLKGVTFDFPYYIVTEFFPNKSIQDCIDAAYKEKI